MLRWGAIAQATVAVWGCSGTNVFPCQTSVQCGENGTCQATGFCSFPDGACPSGERYGQLAGDGLAGECVEPTMGTSTGPPPTSTSTQPLPSTSGTSVPLTGGESSSGGTTMGPPPLTTAAESSSSSTGSVAVPDGIVAWWRLDDDPWDGVRDSSGNGFHGECAAECPAQDAGRVDGGYAFGAAEQIAVEDDPAFVLEAFTITAWARPRAVAVNEHITVVAKPVGTGVHNSWELLFSSPGTAGLRLTFGCGMATNHVHANEPLEGLGEWMHIVGVYDGSFCRLYIDGERVAEVSQPMGGLEWDDAPIMIGADIDEGRVVNLFDGEIDDVRLYSRVLDDEEIAELSTE